MTDAARRDTAASGGRAEPGSAPEAILGRLMLAFDGTELPEAVARRLGSRPAAGMTLFRWLNVRTPGQVRALADEFQAAAARRPGHDGLPLLIAADQEGGQFLALGEGATPFAGNMALGAVDDPKLTERVAAAIGREARAMGVNVVYAPCLDLATDPDNPALGIRAFGDDPAAVARHGVAFVRGLQSAGVAATVKHAPGMGQGSVDTHHGLAVNETARAELEAREFVPFRAAFTAGASADGDVGAVGGGDGPRLAMLGHAALPAVSGRRDLPGSISRAVVTDLLRGALEFRGVTISDALDMASLAQGPAQVVDVIAAILAGEDLLLGPPNPVALERIEDTLVRGVARGVFDASEATAADGRVLALRRWIASEGRPPDLDVVGGPTHRALERELAERSMTLVRDPGRLIGDRVARRSGRVLAVMPAPTDLTPADTSSAVAPGLATALRDGRIGREVQEIVIDGQPDDEAIAAVRMAAASADLMVVGTIEARRRPSQWRLIEALAATGRPMIAVAMRGPWDLAGYPSSVTALATYGILPGSLRALAAVLAGDLEPRGRLPVRSIVAPPPA